MTNDERITILQDILTAPIDAALVIRELEQRGVALYRKRQMRNGRRPNASTPMSADLASKIRTTFAANPDFTQAEIAALYRVNPGRVAEALAGEH